MTFKNINRLMGDPSEGDFDTQSSGSVRIVQFKYEKNIALEKLLAEIEDAELSERDSYRLGSAWAAALPEEMQRAVLYFTRFPAADALVIKGLPLGKIADRKTPVVHGDARPVGSFEALCIAIGMLCGNPIGYATQQKGKLINDIVPISQGADVSNFSGGFKQQFEFHTEDAFMSSPPSYIQLGCVRNPTATPLTLSSVSGLDIDDENDTILRADNFTVGVNPGQTGWEDYAAGRSPILSGARNRPFLRFNDTETTAVDSAVQSLNSFKAVLLKNAVEAPLEPGDIIIVDNSRLTHARQPYPAKCDGTDRWLLRLVIYRNINAVQGLIPDASFPILSPKGASV